MFPAIHTESETLVGYLDEMLQGVRNAAFGLKDSEARSTPCRSGLSISGIVKHCTWTMRLQVWERTTVPGSSDGAADFMNSFLPTDDETIEELLARFDETRQPYLEVMRAKDPNAVRLAPPQPWEDIHEAHEASERLLLAHHIEEFARHAGHADIIREQIDGATAMALRFAIEGRPGNAFITPWSPKS